MLIKESSRRDEMQSDHGIEGVAINMPAEDSRWFRPGFDAGVGSDESCCCR